MLFIFGGLPATGKSELAAHVAMKFNAVYLRIDTIEQAMRNAGYEVNGPEGYIVAYNIAKENLRKGLNVVSDSVNPIEVTRSAWRNVASEVNVPYYEIEVICSDKKEHKKRVENRPPKVQGLVLPTWKDVLKREYEVWEGNNITIDTAGKTPKESKGELEKHLKERCPEIKVP